MIISDQSKKQNFNKKTLAFAIIASLVLAIVLWQVLSQNQKLEKDQVVCDFEKVKGKNFVSNKVYFSGGESQSSEAARSGQYSAKVFNPEGIAYGPGIKWTDFSAGDLYKVSVWVKRMEQAKATLAISSSKGETYYHGTNRISKREDNGWELIETQVQVPVNKEITELTAYVFTDSKKAVYFDDFEIQKIGNFKDGFSNFVLEEIDLEVNEKNWAKIQDKRDEALRVGILETEDKDWVKAKMNSNLDSIPLAVTMRLKGDWLDHLGGNKWSFRVQTKSGAAWNRMQNFSIQTPAARSFLKEWVLHKFWTREGVLSPRYDFIQIKINQQERGIYAYEEHFDKILLEFNKRREGPIIKFTEEGFWIGLKKQLQELGRVDHSVKQNIKEVLSSDIKPFKEKRTQSAENLNKNFQEAQNLLTQYKLGTKPVSEVFDVELLAKYYAIIDVTGAYHAVAWHNQRFYYNPISAKLEPIGFDGFEEQSNYHSSFLGQGAMNPDKIDDSSLHKRLFLDKDFTERYIFYLEKYSHKNYLDAFMAQIENDLADREKTLQAEFVDYKFNKNEFFEDAFKNRLFLYPENEQSVKAFSQEKRNGRRYLKIGNTHDLPVVLLGTGQSKKRMTNNFTNSILLKAFVPRQYFSDLLNNHGEKELPIKLSRDKMEQAHFEQNPLDFYDLEVSESSEYLFYKTLGLDSVFYSKISNWPLPINETSIQKLFANPFLKSNEVYSVVENLISFKAGQHKIDQPIVIPQGMRVNIPAGTELDLVQNAFIISKSPVFLNGTPEDKVKIQSSDFTGQGLTVLETNQQSTLKNVIFDQQKNLSYGNWSMTGAVNFYKADVSIRSCSFLNNNSEDGLNIISSEFELLKSTVQNAMSDGLDVDFGKGKIENCIFRNTKNDGIDLSGSVITIKDCVLEKNGDKSLSVGEESDVSVFSMTVNEAPIGVAAKDLSVLLIKEIQLNNCEQGFVAYQKKPEYGGGNIIVEKYSAENVKRLYNIQANSMLQLPDKVIKN